MPARPQPRDTRSTPLLLLGHTPEERQTLAGMLGQTSLSLHDFPSIPAVCTWLDEHPAPLVLISARVADDAPTLTTRLSAHAHGSLAFFLPGNPRVPVLPGVCRIPEGEGYLARLQQALAGAQTILAATALQLTQLQRTNHYLNHTLATSSTVLFSLELRDGRLMPRWVSDNISDVLGFTREETRSDDWWLSHVHPQDREKALMARSRLLQQGESQTEYRMLNKYGHSVWLRDRTRLLPDELGGEVVGTWADISRAKEEARLQQARMDVRNLIYDGASLQQVLSSTLQHLEDMFPVWRGAILLFDPSIQRYSLGAAPSLGLGFAQMFDSGLSCASRPGSEHNCALVAPHPQVHTDLATLSTCKDWRQRAEAAGLHALWTHPLQDARGQLLGVCNLYAESAPAPTAAAQLQLEEFCQIAALAIERITLDQHRRQAAAVLANTHDGVIITDLAPRIIAVNKAWTEMSGFSEAEALGQNPSVLRSHLQGPDFFEHLWAALLTDGHWHGEIWNRRKNGEIFPQQLSISVVQDDKGNPTHYVGVMTDLSRLKQSEDERDRLIHYDPLTELPNRLLAHSRLEHALSQAQRDRRSLAVLFLDLDGFKTINDSLGHAAGDQVLLGLAARFKQRLRNSDTLARLGGDEFLMLLEGIHQPDEAGRVARQLLDLLHAPLQLLDRREVFVGACIGISIFPNDGASAEELIQRAEIALDQAKQRGHDNLCFYAAEMSERVRQHLDMETHMRRALERGEFFLHYQPQVDLSTGDVRGAEALMRWHSPELGWIPPSSFIPIAEQNGLITALGAYALREACRQNRTWLDAGLPPLNVAVNVSLRQFRARDLVEQVRQALEQSGLPADQLELELTESAFVDDAESAIAICHRLHALGVKISLDDFGTGYSSLAYLSRFPFDKIKIDQSFVRDITSNPTNAAIAKATIALASSLHMSVLAEGVEDMSQLRFLQQRGCGAIQGFLFSRPLPAETFTALLHEGRRLSLAPALASAPRTLLVIDDEPNILRALQRELRPLGYQVLTTTSPQEAFALLATHAVSVVLSDQRMPEMSGSDFLARVRDLYPHCVRIALSGEADAQLVATAVNRGAIFKFLLKPWDSRNLAEVVAEAFRIAEARDPVPPG